MNIRDSLFGGSDSRGSACNSEDPASIPGPGKSPGEGNGTLIFLPGEYNGNWRATVHGVPKNWTQLSDLHFHFSTFPCHKKQNGNWGK